MVPNTYTVEFKPTQPKLKKYIPFVLTVLVIIIDQITKALVVAHIQRYQIGASFFGDFLRIIHVSNPGIAFSIGQGWSVAVRGILFRAVPLVVILLVIGVYVRNDDFTALQRWAIAGIIGGGLGNLIDRFVRAEGVVDFIDVKFYGLFGFERWPTFNVADSAVVVCGILLIISFLITLRKEKQTGATA